MGYMHYAEEPWRVDHHLVVDGVGGVEVFGVLEEPVQ
jgi:hypothetical protein